MTRTAVINVVGLTESLLGPAMPRLSRFRDTSSFAHIEPAFPALTCTAQSNYLTGTTPSQHGIVGNGWYNRELAEVQFWKQSNHLVERPKIWDHLKACHPGFTCANLFWWFNMYSTVDYSVTPRPMYPADGRKVFDIYTWPYSIRTEIKKDLGEFPFPAFWGPGAGAKTPQGERDAVSRWIGAAARWIEQKHAPTLSLIYLPHLDYNLQRFGPNDPRIAQDLAEIDAIAGDLLDFFHARGVKVVFLSEYGITPVNRAIHLNRLFRQQGWLTIKEELGREMLDCGASRVFAVADHQVAHVYVNDALIMGDVRHLLNETPGVARVISGSHREDAETRRETEADQKANISPQRHRGHREREEQTPLSVLCDSVVNSPCLRGELSAADWGIDHPRAGDLIAVAEENAWFTYYYWLDDALAPDFARTVDIHRKPGYDPVELFLDPALRWPQARIARRLLQKKLGFRMLMDVIPLDASLVKGSHGTRPASKKDWPVFFGEVPLSGDLPSTEVARIIAAGVEQT